MGTVVWAVAVAGLVVMSIAGASGPSEAQVAPDERIARVEAGLLPRAVARGSAGRHFTIAERMTYHGVPGMSVAVVEDGLVVWSRAYGVLTSGEVSRVTSETLFQAASLSKPATAVGALALVQRRQLELGADVRDRLRSWKPEQPLTLRQLLSHTAGVSVPGFAGYIAGAPLPTTTAILKGEPPANSSPVRVTLPPGKQVSYSGGGYVIVQQLIADVTKQSFTEYMKAAVFMPLGMTRSTFEQPLFGEGARRAAVGHRRDGSKITGNAMVHPELAAAGLWSTSGDLARLIVEMQDAMAARPARLLTSETAREMLTGRIGNAGLGVFLDGPNGTSRRFTHSGRNAGFDARIVGYKNGRQGAVVMINRNNNGLFVDEVLESIAREYRWPDYIPAVEQVEYVTVPSSVQASFAGTYEASGQSALVVIVEDEKLFARAGGDEWMRLYPSSQSEFFVLENATRWMFVRSKGGAAAEVVVRDPES